MSIFVILFFRLYVTENIYKNCAKALDNLMIICYNILDVKRMLYVCRR